MADPVDAAAVKDDDVEDLYADLDDQVAAALAAAGESGGSNARDSDPATDGEAEVPGSHAEVDANEAVDLGDGSAGYISSDEESEDDLHIVLNEEGSAPPLPPAGRSEERWVEESEVGEVPGSCVKGPSISDCCRGKHGELQWKELLEKTTVPVTGQNDRGYQHACQKEFYFFLPRNRSVFDIDIEAFQHKPWKEHGVDLTDYFNFGLDEESWRKYCFDMEHFRHGVRTLAKGPLGLEQESHYNLGPSKLVPKSVTFSGSKERNELVKPKGRAIHVEGGVHGRLPSADMWPPRQRDSDVIQVKVMLSPSNHSTSDDSSTVNHKCATTKRQTSNHPGVGKCMKETSFVVDRVVDKEVHKRDFSECARSKSVLGDYACARVQSPNSDYSDMLSEESTEDCYFKRTHRNSNSKSFYVETNRKDEHVLSDACHKSDQESSKSEGHRYTPADDRYYKMTKRLKTDEPGGGKSSQFLNSFHSDRHLLKSGHKATKELKRQSLGGGSHALVEKQENMKDSYSSRYAGKYKHKISGSSSIGNNYRVRNHSREKLECLPLERVAFRNDEQCSNDSDHQHRRSWRKFNDDEYTGECFSSARQRQRSHDHVQGCHSMLNAELYDDNDGHMYREKQCKGTREVRHDHKGDPEFFLYTNNRFGKVPSPEVRRRYRMRSAESSDVHFKRPERLVFEHFRHSDHLMLSCQANDNIKKSEKDWRISRLTSMSSRRRFVDNRKSQNAKMKYDDDGYYKNKTHHDSAFGVDNIQQSSLYTGSVVETGHCIRPVKRKAHADMGSMNCKDFFSSSYSKGRRLTHQSMISDRKLYAADMHNSSKGIDVEAICSLSDMRNSSTIPNIYDERRHEFVNLQPKDADSFHLNHRKRKFNLQGIEVRREVENGSERCLTVDTDLNGSKHKNARHKVRKSRIDRISGNQVLEKSTQEKQQHVCMNEEFEEIEVGELIEQDYQETVSKSKLNQTRKVVLKSVIEASSAGHGGVINAISKDPVCINGATRECDNEHILEVMKKMQKRSERFKEPFVPRKEEDEHREEFLATSCSADIKNQRPARKQRWGCSG